MTDLDRLGLMIVAVAFTGVAVITLYTSALLFTCATVAKIVFQ